MLSRVAIGCIALVAAECAMGASIFVPSGQPTIQAGINAAAMSGDEIVVSPGTYNEIIDTMGKAVTIRAAWGPSQTFIDATGVAPLADGKPVVRIDSGEGAGTVIEGFTITGGTGDTALFGGLAVGGGVFVAGAGPTINWCVIENNAANSGCGVFVYQGSVVFEDVTIRDHVAGSLGAGAGVYALEVGTLSMTDCVVTGNNAPDGWGGGLYVDTGTGTVHTTGTVFNNNSCMREGGAIHVNFGGGLTISGCSFRGNAGTASLGGGALYAGAGADVLIDSCEFIGNDAFQPALGDGDGGAVYSDSDAVIVDSVFSRNRADRGGALGLTGTSLVANCSFSGNSSAVGSVVRNESGTHRMVNCAAWGNTGSAPFEDPFNTWTVDHSIVEGGWSGAGVGNLNVDPMFADAANDDLRLLAGSPAIDAGDTVSAAGVVGSVDYDGNDRLLDDPVVADTGIAAFGEVIDIGAYESLSGLPCDGDANGDHVVDVNDISYVLFRLGNLCP